MRKIMMPTEEKKGFLEVFELFVISQSAKGMADITIRNYRYHIIRKLKRYRVSASTPCFFTLQQPLK